MGSTVQSPAQSKTLVRKRMVSLHHLKMIFPHHLKMLITGNKPISELRVPCPYDPKHTCFASKMDKHLRICNSKVIKIL